MKTIRFLLQKIIIIEVMLIILFIAQQTFQINIPIISTIIYTGLKYLTPISIAALILYVVLSILSTKIVEIALGIVLGIIILYYLFTYIL